MRTAILAGLLLALSALPVSASGVHVAPIERAQPAFTCAGGSLSRVAFATPAAPCCTGQFGCPQLLSNTGLAKPHHDHRT